MPKWQQLKLTLKKTEARIKLQALNIMKHRDHEKKQLEQRRVAEHTTWLQEEYASLLFERCRAHYKRLGSICHQDFAIHLNNLIHTGRFNETILFSILWKPDTSACNVWGKKADVNNVGHWKPVRCSPRFAKVIEVLRRDVQNYKFGHGHVSHTDAAEVLLMLLIACIGPTARDIFVADKVVRKLLHLNDHSLDKTFVYAVFLLSKVLGSPRWSCGVFTWPPCSPTAAAHSVVLAADNVEPCTRVTQPSSSNAPA